MAPSRYWKPKSERGQGPFKPFTLFQGAVGARSFTTLDRAVKAVMPGRGLFFVIDNRLPRWRRGQAVVAGNDPRECDFIKEDK
jgi:hypothetical protein